MRLRLALAALLALTLCAGAAALLLGRRPPPAPPPAPSAAAPLRATAPSSPEPAAAAAAVGESYYVDAALGDDRASGRSPERPWRSLTRAAAAGLGPGDRLLLRRGARWEEQLSLAAAGSREAPATIGAYGEGPPPSLRSVRLEGARWLIIRELHVAGGSRNGVALLGGGNNRLLDLAVEGLPLRGIVIENSSHNEVRGSTVVGCGQDGVAFLQTDPGLLMEGNSAVGNTVHANGGVGLHVRGIDAAHRIAGTQILSNTAEGNGDGAYLRYAADTTVQGNTLRGNTRDSWEEAEQYGIGLQTASGSRVIANLIAGNNFGAEVWGGAPTAERPRYGRSDDNHFIGNRFVGNVIGLKFGTDYSRGSLAEGNLMVGNTRYGALIYGAPDAAGRLVGNTFADNAKGVQIEPGSAGWTVSGNIFSNNGVGLSLSTSTTEHSGNCYDGDVAGANRVSYRGAELLTFEPSATLGAVGFVDRAAGDYRLAPGSACAGLGAAGGAP